MKVKKVIIAIVIIVFVVYLILLKMSFAGWSDGVTGRSEEMRQTSLGDKFLFKYVDINFPSLARIVDIYNYEGEELLVTYTLHDGDTELNSDIVAIINLPNIRCYEICGQLIYRVNNEQFEGIDISLISITDTEAFPSLIIVARELVNTKEWKWIKAFGSFLLKAGDDDIKILLKRWANSEFTEEELQVNKNSEFNKEDMVSYAKQVLKEKNSY